MTGDILYSSYRIILKKIEEADGELECNKDNMNTNTYSAALEWMLISIVNAHSKNDNMLLLAKL